MPMKYWEEDYDQAEQKHFTREKMSTNVRKIEILVAAKVKSWIMDALWNPSRAKAKKKLEASEKLNFVHPVHLILPSVKE